MRNRVPHGGTSSGRAVLVAMAVLAPLSTFAAAGVPATVEWQVPVEATHPPQSKAQDLEGMRVGRALPTPEVASKFLHFDAASPEDISEEFLLGVAKLLQVPSALLAAPVTRTRVIETIRRDVWLGSRARFTANNATQTIDAPLPMLLFGGAQDSVPTFDKRAGQAMYGITPIAVKCVPGGHLFIDDEQGRKEVVEELIRHVR